MSTPETNRDNERQAYRHALANALNKARQFDGLEASADEVIDATAEFETTVRDILELDEGAVSAEDQEFAAEVFHKKTETVTVDTIIDKAVEVFQRKLEKEINKIKLKSKTIDKSFFPPSDLDESDGVAQSDRNEKLKIIARLPLLLPELMRRGIYLDDVILYEGRLAENQWRTVPYYILEIPRLRSQVLICDEIGEQTYVVKDLMSPEFYASVSKSELLESFPGKVIPVRFQRQWAQLVADQLLNENLIVEKVDLDFRDQLIEDLKAQFPSPKDWMAQGTAKRRALSSLGKKLGSIATALGADPSLQAYKYVDFLKLGRLVYGAENEVLNQQILLESGDYDEWRKVLKLAYPNSDELLKVKAHKFPSIGGHGLRSISSLLKVNQFIDLDSDLVKQISLADFLFPGDDLVSKKKKEYKRDHFAVEELKKDPSIFIESIKEEFPDAKSFLEEKVHLLTKKRYLDVRLPMIVSVVSQRGAKNLLYEHYLAFAEKIYQSPEDQEYIAYLKYIESIIDDPEKAFQEIRKIKPSSGEWPKYKKALDTFSLGRYSLKVLFTKLGVDDPSLGRGRDIIIYHDFLMAAYPDEDHTALQLKRDNLREARYIRDSLGKDQSKWSAYFQSKYPNYQAWLDAGFDRVIGSRSLVWIAKNVYGIDPPSYRNTRITLEKYKEMGRMIFPN